MLPRPPFFASDFLVRFIESLSSRSRLPYLFKDVMIPSSVQLTFSVSTYPRVCSTRICRLLSCRLFEYELDVKFSYFSVSPTLSLTEVKTSCILSVFSANVGQADRTSADVKAADSSFFHSDSSLFLFYGDRKKALELTN